MPRQAEFTRAAFYRRDDLVGDVLMNIEALLLAHSCSLLFVGLGFICLCNPGLRRERGVQVARRKCGTWNNWRGPALAGRRPFMPRKSHFVLAARRWGWPLSPS